MPKLKSLAEAYGSETAFTKALAANKDWLSELYDEVNYHLPENPVGLAEVQTDLGKRVDVVVYDGEDANCVIECQDQTGVLDPIHAAKIAYYMSSHGVDRGILLCDSAPNETKTFIREQNTYMPRDISIVSVRFLDKEPVFTSLELPYDRKTRAVASVANTRAAVRKASAPVLEALSKLEFVEPIAPSDNVAIIKLRPDVRKWASPNDVICIVPQKTKITLEIPCRFDPETLFPDLAWYDHLGKTQNGVVMKAGLPTDIDIASYITEVYEKLVATGGVIK